MIPDKEIDLVVRVEVDFLTDSLVRSLDDGSKTPEALSVLILDTVIDQLIVFDCRVYRSEDVPPQNFIYFEV